METPRKQKRLEKLLLTLRSAAEDEPIPSVEVLEEALEGVEEATALRPDDFTIAAYARTIANRLTRAKSMATKLQQARADARRGWLDEAVREAESASKLDPPNEEARQYAEKLKNEREQILTILEQAKGLIEASEFTAARKKLLIARDLNGAYPPVQQMNCLLAEKRREHDDQVSDRLDEICAANERKEFDKVLELTEALRASMKPYGRAAEQLKQQELRARTFLAEKEKRRQLFKDAHEKLQAHDYAGALAACEELLENVGSLCDGEEQEYADAHKYREEALRKQKRLEGLLLALRYAAEDEPVPSIAMLEQALGVVDEALILRPDDPAIAAYTSTITQRLNRAREEQVRLVEAQEPPKPEQAEEEILDSTDSSCVTPVEPKDETCEEETHIDPAISNEGSIVEPDDASESMQENQAEWFEALPALSDIHASPLQLSEQLPGAGDRLIEDARSEQCLEESRRQFAQGLENYRRSLQACGSPDVSIPDETIDAVESEKQSRMVGEYLSEAEGLERKGRIVEALVMYQKALASSDVSMPPENHAELQVKIKALTHRINTVRDLRARGEAQETQGQIADAIESFKQSLELVPDKSLEEHVTVLEEEVARVKDEGVTDILSQESATALQSEVSNDALETQEASNPEPPDPATEESGLELKAKMITHGRRDDTIKFREETFARKIRR